MMASNIFFKFPACYLLVEWQLHEFECKARLTLCDFLLCDPCDTLQRNTEQCCATCRAMRVLRSTPHTVRFVAIISVLRMRIQ